MVRDENSKNPLQQLRAEIESGSPKAKQSKANHTLYLTEPQYRIFAGYCRFKGARPSEVIDRLIGIYLAEVQDDLPPDTAKPD